MKIDSAALIARKPQDLWGVLFYGDDEHFLKARSSQLLQTLFPDSTNITFHTCTNEEFQQNYAALTQQRDLFAPIRAFQVITVLDATDRLLEYAQQCTINTHCFLTLITLEPSKCAKLRAWAEKESQFAVATAYMNNDKDRASFLNHLLKELDLTLTPEALHYFILALNDGSESVVANLKKLRLFRAPPHTFTLEDVQLCCDEKNAGENEQLGLALGERNAKQMYLAYQQASLNGLEDIAIIRMLMAHLNKLLQIKAHIEGGKSFEQAVSALRPPLFFKHQPLFKKHIALWTLEEIYQALTHLNEAELTIKQGKPWSDLATAEALRQIVSPTPNLSP